MSVVRSQTRRGLSPANSSEGYAPASIASTPSKASRVSVSKGAARVTVASRSSTDQRSMTVIATSCWASTSRGLRGIAVASIRPSRIRSATTAHSRRSPRYFGKITPRLTSSMRCPARPTRCSPRATEVGDSTWITRSIAPMSIPSSSDEVATSAGSRPSLSASSIATRCSRAIEPWWARTRSSPASSLRRCARRSARRRLFTNTSVLRCARISSRIRGWIAGQMLTRRSPPPPGAARLVVRGERVARVAHVLDRHDDREVQRLPGPGIHDRDRAAFADARQEAPDRLERPLGRRQADPLEGRRAGRAEVLQALQAQREVRAALRAGDGVDLVDDHVLHAPQDLARLRR